MILIPVKNLSNAKQRLSPVLDQCTRTELARAMLRDVLEAVCRFGQDEVSLVTSDAYAMELAAHFRLGVIADHANLSETSAIEAATQICMERGVNSTLVIPGDVPLIEADDLLAIYEAAPATGAVLVPSADKRGTNSVLRLPADLFPLRFGNDSFMPHLASAIATNTSCVVLSLPRIAIDVDNAEDLQRVALAVGDKPSQVMARNLGFAAGVLPANTYENVQSSSSASKA